MMSSSLLDFSLNENAVSFRCIALRKTSDLYKSCVEYFLLKISVICSPVFLFFLKKTFLLMCLYEDILYLCECKQQRGSRCVTVRSVYE